MYSEHRWWRLLREIAVRFACTVTDRPLDQFEGVPNSTYVNMLSLGPFMAYVVDLVRPALNAER